MKPTAQGYRVAVVGASSLLGKELLTVLEERKFPVSRLVTFEAGEDEPGLPIVDLRESSQAAVADGDVSEQELDFAFLAARPQGFSGAPAFLRRAIDGNARRPGPDGGGLGPAPGTPANHPEGIAAPHCFLIDLSETLVGVPGRIVAVPFLDRDSSAKRRRTANEDAGLRFGGESRLFVSAHPAAILISSLLLRLSARFALERAVAQVFTPVSEIGTRAIEELQKQTVNLLSFQKIPQAIFGAQLAFNLLPRLGRGRKGSGHGASVGTDELAHLDARLRSELREYLSGRAPLPALCIVQTAVFYSLAVSLYIEAAADVAPEALAQALEGEPIRVRRLSQQAPSQVEATGSPHILVDAIARDAEHPRGIWIWAVADNLRLAAVNALEIAESLRGPVGG